MRTLNRGFTMVELIVVIVILGILAAVALPRFTNMQRDGRIAKLNAARGAVLSASAMVHGAALARQNVVQPACAGGGFGANPPLVNLAGTGNLCTENGRVQVTSLYPTASLAGIVATSGVIQVAGTPTAAQLAAEGYVVAVAGAVSTFQVAGGTAPATCSFTYTQPATLGEAPVVSAVNTAGC